MENPFVFRIRMSKAAARRRRLLLAVTAAALLIVFAAGYITVYVNSYNILHAAPMEVFSLYRTSDGVEVIFLGRLFTLPGL